MADQPPQPPQPQPPLLVGSGPTATLVRDCPSFTAGFTPAPLLSSPHAQTLYGIAREPVGRLRRRFWFSPASSSSPPSPSSDVPASGGGSSKSSTWAFRRQLVHCEDGGTIALDWWEEERKTKTKTTTTTTTTRNRQQQQQQPPSPSFASTPPPLPPTAPLLLVLHGLTGGSKEAYIRSLCSHATARGGFRAVAVVYRGCGGLALTSPRGYSATLTADVAAAARQARREFPLARATVAVGFSLGAVILCKYLGEQDAGYWAHRRFATGGRSGGGGDGAEEREQQQRRRRKHHFRHSPHQGFGGGGGGGGRNGEDGSRDGNHDDLIDAAVAVSSPFCLESAGVRLSRPWTVGWIYNAGLALRLKHYMWTHRAQILGGGRNNGGEHGKNNSKTSTAASAIDRRALAAAYLVSHIDDAASARANGYEDRESYYDDAATRKAVPHITRTPLLFVSSADDPFLGDLPLSEIEHNPRTALVMTERGGHCAFLDREGEGEGQSAWVDRLAVEWLSRAVGEEGKREHPLSKL